ncbi:hypothetical protein ESCO_001473 [Escovopsis weberi]|uniref:Uncharacterized protein n=1 Tax=Escovopsis weberi TaxID=150374 RepID=A0A0N0RU26_ESCWE|nr:hypothetical protein ESCO_001473 [Escovopsis weberi]
MPPGNSSKALGGLFTSNPRRPGPDWEIASHGPVPPYMPSVAADISDAPTCSDVFFQHMSPVAQEYLRRIAYNPAHDLFLDFVHACNIENALIAWSAHEHRTAGT